MTPKALLFFLLLSLIKINVFSQSISISVIGSYGNYSTASSGNLSANVGEPMIATRTTATNIITEGFEQPDDILPLSTQNFFDNSVEFNAYPNPFDNKVIVSSAFFFKDAELKITDIAGKELLLIRSTKAFGSGDQIEIETENFKKGVYFITILDKETYSRVKIIQVIKA